MIERDLPTNGSRINGEDQRLENRLYPGETAFFDEMDNDLERDFSVSFIDGVLVVTQFLNPDQSHHSPYAIYLKGVEVEFGDIIARYAADRGRDWREVPTMQRIEQSITELTSLQIVDTNVGRPVLSLMVDPFLPSGGDI